MEGKVTCMSVPYFFLLPSTKEGRSPRVSVEVHVDFYRNPWAAALASIVVKAPESGGQFEWVPQRSPGRREEEEEEEEEVEE